MSALRQGEDRGTESRQPLLVEPVDEALEQVFGRPGLPRIEHSLERTAHRYEKELQKVIDRGMAMITPVIILVMAVVVGAMAYMMVSIILQSVTSIRR